MIVETGCVEMTMHMSQPRMVRLYDKTVSSVVFIEVEVWCKRRVYRWCGSGVFIEPGLIITAGHVVGSLDRGVFLDPNMITVTTYDGRLLPVIEVFDEDYNTADLGLLRVEMPRGFKPYYPKIDVITKIGEEILVIGAPAGNYPMMTHGFIAGPPVEGMEPNSLNMQIDCAINSGNSGGPMFGMNGDLIGIIVAVPNRTIGLAWVEQASTIYEMLGNWKHGRTLPKEERSWEWQNTW